MRRRYSECFDRLADSIASLKMLLKKKSQNSNQNEI